MLPICTFAEIEGDLTRAFVERYPKGSAANVRMAGILFARPESPLAKSEIVNSIAYFNQLTADHIDFFCAGYGVGDNDDMELQDFEWVSTGGSGSARYRFSNRGFVSSRRPPRCVQAAARIWCSPMLFLTPPAGALSSIFGQRFSASLTR